MHGRNLSKLPCNIFAFAFCCHEPRSLSQSLWLCFLSIDQSCLRYCFKLFFFFFSVSFLSFFAFTAQIKHKPWGSWKLSGCQRIHYLSFIISNALKLVCLQAAGFVHVCSLKGKIKPPGICNWWKWQKMFDDLWDEFIWNAESNDSVRNNCLYPKDRTVFAIFASSHLPDWCVCVWLLESILLQHYGHNYPYLDSTRTHILIVITHILRKSGTEYLHYKLCGNC